MRVVESVQKDHDPLHWSLVVLATSDRMHISTPVVRERISSVSTSTRRKLLQAKRAATKKNKPTTTGSTTAASTTAASTTAASTTAELRGMTRSMRAAVPVAADRVMTRSARASATTKTEAPVVSARKVPARKMPKPETVVKSVPEESVPEESVPEESVPQESVPQESVPQESVPQESVPQESVPEESMAVEPPSLKSPSLQCVVASDMVLDSHSRSDSVEQSQVESTSPLNLVCVRAPSPVGPMDLTVASGSAVRRKRPATPRTLVSDALSELRISSPMDVTQSEALNLTVSVPARLPSTNIFGDANMPEIPGPEPEDLSGSRPSNLSGSRPSIPAPVSFQSQTPPSPPVSIQPFSPAGGSACGSPFVPPAPASPLTLSARNSPLTLSARNSPLTLSARNSPVKMHLAEYVPLKARVKVHLAPELDDAELEKAEVVGLGSWTPGWWKELSPIPPEVKWARQYWVPLDKDGYNGLAVPSRRSRSRSAVVSDSRPWDPATWSQVGPCDSVAEDVRNVAVYVPSRVGVTKLTSKLFRTSFDAYLALHETLSQESWRHLRTIGLEGFSSCDYHLLELGAIIAAYLPTPFGDVATPLREELYRVIELRKAGHWVTGCLLQHAAKVAEGGTDLQGAFVQRLVDFCINTLGYTPVAGAKPLCLRTVEVLRPECVDRPALSKMPVERRRELLMEQLAAVDRYTNEFEAIKINARQFQAMTKNPVAWTRTPDSQTPSPVSWTRTEEVPAKKQKPLPLDDSDRADVEAMVEQIFRDNQSSLASCLDQCLDQCLTQTTNSPEWISNALGSLDITETGEIADSDWTDVLGSLDITEIEAELAGGDQHITPHTSPLINENGDFLDEILASIEQNGERLCAP